MRVIFLTLLFANAAFFAWAHWVDVAPHIAASDSTQKLPRLKLAGETPAGPGAGMQAKPRPTAIAASQAPQACLSVGPFPDPAAANRAAASLQEKGFEPKQRLVEGESSQGYWVYIGQLKNEATAKRVMALLAGSGIKDAQLMPETEEGARVSVGLFSDRERADKRVRVVQKIGLPAQVAERKLTVNVYWEDIKVPANSITSPLEGLVFDSQTGHVSVQACPGAEAGSPAAVPAVTQSAAERGKSTDPTSVVP